MGFYDELQDVAAEVLREFRQGTVLLLRPVEAAADSSTPWTPGAATTTTYTLDVVGDGVKQQFINGTLVKASERKVTCSPYALTAAGARVLLVPDVKDTLSIDGQQHEIKRVEPVPAIGTPVIFELFVAA